jgi:hypothetical protein
LVGIAALPAALAIVGATVIDFGTMNIEACPVGAAAVTALRTPGSVLIGAAGCFGGPPARAPPGCSEEEQPSVQLKTNSA